MIIDVAIHTNDGFLGADHALQVAHPPLEEKCELGQGLWVGRLDGKITRAVMEFCSSTCMGTYSPFLQYSGLYAFVRELPADYALARWDEDNQLTNCVGLSRLIHPTSIGYRFAARVRTPSESGKIQLCKADLTGIDREAYVAPSVKRNWLTASEAAELKGLLALSPFANLPKRVSNALWYHEFAYRTWFADLRWTLVSTALESLLNTDNTSNKKQFITRTIAMALELGLQFSEDDARTAYQVRSKLAHGQAFLYGLPQAELRIYEQMELLLRGAILKSMRDPSFARSFDSADTIRARWPIQKA